MELSPNVTLIFADRMHGLYRFIKRPFSGMIEIVAPVSIITGSSSPHNSKYAMSKLGCVFICATAELSRDTV